MSVEIQLASWLSNCPRTSPIPILLDETWTGQICSSNASAEPASSMNANSLQMTGANTPIRTAMCMTIAMSVQERHPRLSHSHALRSTVSAWPDWRRCSRSTCHRTRSTSRPTRLCAVQTSYLFPLNYGYDGRRWRQRFSDEPFARW